MYDMQQTVMTNKQHTDRYFTESWGPKWLSQFGP